MATDPLKDRQYSFMDMMKAFHSGIKHGTEDSIRVQQGKSPELKSFTEWIIQNYDSLSPVE